MALLLGKGDILAQCVRITQEFLKDQFILNHEELLT
jgi:hypothetical protein